MTRDKLRQRVASAPTGCQPRDYDDDDDDVPEGLALSFVSVAYGSAHRCRYYLSRFRRSRIECTFTQTLQFTCAQYRSIGYYSILTILNLSLKIGKMRSTLTTSTARQCP
jgi:hypothetical protein